MAHLHCTRRGCRGRTKIIATIGPESPRLSPELKGLNVIVRRHKCSECAGGFRTIEVDEVEFNRFKKPASASPAAVATVRPGRKP